GTGGGVKSAPYFFSEISLISLLVRSWSRELEKVAFPFSIKAKRFTPKLSFWYGTSSTKRLPMKYRSLIGTRSELYRSPVGSWYIAASICMWPAFLTLSLQAKKRGKAKSKRKICFILEF